VGHERSAFFEVPFNQGLLQVCPGQLLLQSPPGFSWDGSAPDPCRTSTPEPCYSNRSDQLPQSTARLPDALWGALSAVADAASSDADHPAHTLARSQTFSAHRTTPLGNRLRSDL
jgi:hypothetical protein